MSGAQPPDTDRREIEALMALDLDDLRADLVWHYAMGRDGRPRARFDSPRRDESDAFEQFLQEALDEAKENVRALLCDRLEYCRRVRDDRTGLVWTIADTVIISVFGLKFPPLALTVLLMRLGVLDRFCGCDAAPG